MRMRKKTMVDAVKAVKKYYLKNGTWDFPEGVVIDGVTLNRWWKNTRSRLLDGSAPDELVRMIKNEEIDFGFRPLFQREWYEFSQKWIKEYGSLKKSDVCGDYKIGVWYFNYQSTKLRDSNWFENMDKFRQIWTSKEAAYSGIPLISGQTPWYWAVHQKNAKDLPYYKVQAMEALVDVPWDDPARIEDHIRKRVKEKSVNVLEKQLQEIVDTGSMNGVISMEAVGIVTMGKKLAADGSFYYLCEACVNSMFTEKQYLEYVAKMKKRIYKEAKALFLQKRKSDRLPVEAKNVRLYQMTSNRKTHVLSVVFHVKGPCFAPEPEEKKEEEEEEFVCENM